MNNLSPTELIRRFFVLGLFRAGLYIGQGTLYILHQIARFLEHTLRSMRVDYDRFCGWVDYEMFGGVTVSTKAVAITDAPTEIYTILDVIADKHVKVIGGTGSGKSTLARYLAYQVGGRVTVYECEGCPGDWTGLEVLGRAENWEEISQGMQWDLDYLSAKVEARASDGDAALVGTERVLICEEFPEVKDKVSCAAKWLERHARRGRKMRQFLILLSQYDRVSAWGLDGKSDLADCFVKIRLGKAAANHAKRLKSAYLLDWLSQSKSHCLADDLPCKLPSPEEMNRTSQSYLPVSHELSNRFVEIQSKPTEGNTAKFRETVIEGIGEGLSDYAILRHKVGVSGGSKYQKLKREVENIREAFGASFSE